MVEMRALTPGRARAQPPAAGRVLDDEGKIVVRLQAEEPALARRRRRIALRAAAERRRRARLRHASSRACSRC